MSITGRQFAQVSLTAGAIALLAAPATPQDASSPIARYTMDATTTSGIGAMGGGGGGLGAAMAMMRGQSQVMHDLDLRLGTTRAPDGAPDADHFMPQGAQLGASVPLVTPRQGVGAPDGPMGELPRGRLLIYWGCDERAGPGQPVVIDFARLAQGQVPSGLYAQNIDLPDDWRITQSTSRTYGHWPNGEANDRRRLQPNSSLLGAHRVAGNYTPDISFNLAEDFMPALQPSTRALPSGAVSLNWGALAKATGYYAWSVGVSEANSRDMVWWTSASTQQFGGPLSEWISPAAARRLIAAKTVMAPSQTECTIPAEVREAGGEAMMTSLFAYGPQVDFAYPPRPENSRTPWRPEWIARVRFRSQVMVIPGMEGMAGGMDDDGEEAAAAPAQQAPAKPRCRGLRGVAERAAGLCE